MILKGVKVLELAGLAPAPFCGMVLADHGATVIKICRKNEVTDDRLSRGKYSLVVDLKIPDGKDVVRDLAKHADVLLEPFRPGIMEKLGLGPKLLMKDNPRLIYARLTGYGTNGPYAKRAGHDINYLAISGVLSKLGRKTEVPNHPINLLADFAGGGMMCSFGILLALYERLISGKGQLIDCSMTEGAAYIGSWLWTTSDMPWWQGRGEGMLDGGSHFYQVYKTKDSKYMAVGALEPKFYAELLKGLELSPEDFPQELNCERSKEKFANIFANKTQNDWISIFENSDACVTPVVDMDEAHTNQHNKARNSFFLQGDKFVPNPAPRLERTPAEAKLSIPKIGEHTNEILQSFGFSKERISELESAGTIYQNKLSESKL